MNVERIVICKNSGTNANKNILNFSDNNYTKQKQNDLFVKSNRNLSFGETTGVGGAAGLGIGAILGLAVAGVLTGGAATLPFLSALGAGLAGSGAVAGGMVGGAIVGDKAEEILKGGKK